MNMIVSIIVAVAENDVIGKNNQLIWHLPADLRRFEQITSGNHVIMGRKTFESVGRPLPNRTNIIITSDVNYKKEGCIVVHSINEAFTLCEGQEEVFILGGSTIYEQTIRFADKLYITRVHNIFDGDSYFIKMNDDYWDLEYEETHQADKKNRYAYSFRNYIRKK